MAIRGVATGALIPAGAGKVLLIAPRPAGGSFASAARAALENLARTLSVEWARYGVTTVAIAPGARTTDEELAELVCFLVSPAGRVLQRLPCSSSARARTLIRTLLGGSPHALIRRGAEADRTLRLSRTSTTRYTTHD